MHNCLRFDIRVFDAHGRRNRAFLFRLDRPTAGAGTGDLDGNALATRVHHSLMLSLIASIAASSYRSDLWQLHPKDFDFYHLDEWLSPEEKMTRDAVRRFVQREVLPHVERHFANETFPLDLVPMMAELGIFGANLNGYGCAGMNNIAYGLIMQELEAGRLGSALVCLGAESLWRCTRSIHAGSEEQKNRYLPEMAQGQDYSAVSG